jgi:clan AA aspartic protease
MGTVYAEITIKNGSDIVRLQDGNITEKDVRSLSVTAVVDTGAISLVINEDVCRKLGLAIEGTRTATLANGGKVDCKITEPVRIYWKDRDATCQAVVLPEGNVLLGVIPLEFMDLIVDPIAEQLVGAHGDRIISRLLCMAIDSPSIA